MKEVKDILHTTERFKPVNLFKLRKKHVPYINYLLMQSEAYIIHMQHKFYIIINGDEFKHIRDNVGKFKVHTIYKFYPPNVRDTCSYPLVQDDNYITIASDIFNQIVLRGNFSTKIYMEG